VHYEELGLITLRTETCFTGCQRLFLNDTDRHLFDEALTDFSSMSADERDGLTAMLRTVGMLYQPNQGNV